MSYDIYLCDSITRKPIEINEPHFMRGGTYKVGGNTELHLNITYNYSEILHRVLDGGIRSLYNKTALETTPLLKAAINQLEDDVSDDYWEPTQGNVKRALTQLLTFAQMRPDGIWDGD